MEPKVLDLTIIVDSSLISSKG